MPSKPSDDDEVAPKRGPGRPVDWEKKYHELAAKLDALEKEREAELASITATDSVGFLKAIWNNPRLPLKDRMRAAITAAQYEHTKKGKAGKKEEAIEAAREASGSTRLRQQAAPPQLKKVA